MPEIPEEALQAADVIEEALRLFGVEEPGDGATAVLGLLGERGMVVVSAELLDALTDPDECWFDHHGGCQAHGFLSLEPGERCPHAEVREILAALPEETTADAT